MFFKKTPDIKEDTAKDKSITQTSEHEEIKKYLEQFSSPSTHPQNPSAKQQDSKQNTNSGAAPAA